MAFTKPADPTPGVTLEQIAAALFPGDPTTTPPLPAATITSPEPAIHLLNARTIEAVRAYVIAVAGGVVAHETALGDLRQALAGKVDPAALTALATTQQLQQGLTGRATHADVAAAVDALKAGAPAAYNTLVEVAGELARGASAETALTNAIAAKYTRPAGGIPLADLAQAVRDAIAAGSGGGGASTIAGVQGLQDALDAKATPAQITTAINALKGSAPAAYDTLVEIAAELARGADAETALTSAIAAKYTRPAGGVPPTDINLPALVADPVVSGAYQSSLTVVAPVTAAVTLAPDTHTPVDASTGALTVTLPKPTRVGQQIRVEKTDSSTNAVTVSGTLRGAAGAVTMPWQYEVRTLIAESLTSWRVASGTVPKSALDGAYESRVSRTGATTGQVVTLLASGQLGLTTPAAGGSGGATPGITATDNGDGTAILDAPASSSSTITDNNDGTAVLAA